jgi:hypothetical protein
MKLLLGTSGMSKVRKTFSRAFLLLVMFCMFAVCSSILFGAVQASTEVSGILSSDTTWTKAGSPYSLIGPILVSEGVTLTIESGASVDLNNQYIQVNGTLRAVGSSSDRIQIYNNGDGYAEIRFTKSSSSWNQTTGSGCIIEHAVIDSVTLYSYISIKINNNSIEGSIHCHDGSAIISNNHLVGYTYSTCAVALSDSGVAMNNTVVCNKENQCGIGSSGDETVISNNTVIGFGFEGTGISDGAYIRGNIVSGFSVGIRASSTLVKNNLIINNTYGIKALQRNNWIYNNTITNNTIGVFSDAASQYLSFNNLLNNTEYNMKVAASTYAVNATYNWWGTTDTQTINQTIFDFKNDFNLCEVNFVPFLTELNPEAPEMPESQQPDTEPEPEPEQSDWHTIIIFVALIVIPIAAGLGLLVYLSKRK